MKKILEILFLIATISNCTRFILSPGVNSDFQIELKESNDSIERREYNLQAFKLQDQNLEITLYDINNFSELNPSFIRNFQIISKEISQSNLAILIEVFSESGLSGLDELTSLEISSSNCDNIKYVIYRYDYIKFILVRGYRSNIYPKYPEEKYSLELQPKMAHIEINELPRKRILIYSDNSCDFRNLNNLEFKLNSHKFKKYSIKMTPSA